MISSGTSRAPTIETLRLVLREQGASDLDQMTEFWGRPEVYRHIDGKPRAREDVWRRILANAGSWALLGFGSWIVEERATHRTVGLFGFLRAEREMSPPFRVDEIEVGWTLLPDVQGQGYALEALRAILSWGDEALGDSTTVCIISPANEPSLRLAAKVGFRERARAFYHGEPVIQFERRGPHA